VKYPPTDLVRVIVVVGNVVFRADVTIGKVASRLDEFEQNVGQALARITRGQNRPPDLTDATRQMIAFGANHELPGWLIVAAMWLAIRGRGTPVSLDELVARARRVCLTITTDDRGRAWDFQVGDVDALEAREPGVALH
jgi:hypothetical protein